MKSLILVFFVLFSVDSFSQNDDYKMYKDAISIVKNSQEFVDFAKDNDLKNTVEIHNSLAPICLYCTWFKDFIDCCEQGKTIIDIMGEYREVDFSKLNDKGNKRIKLNFSRTVKSYFITEISNRKDNQKQQKKVYYLFKIENDSISLVKTSFNYIVKD